MEVDLTSSELFKSFAEFEKDSIYIDLHNEFDCSIVEYSGEQRILTLSFKPNAYCTQNVKNVAVIFNECSIERYSAQLRTKSDIIDTMYRGRFESKDGLNETSDGRYYYYINLLPDMNFEIFAKQVTAIFE